MKSKLLYLLISYDFFISVLKINQSDGGWWLPP
jgi:hypothetical protein